jgi:hypothetical protein
MDDNTTYPAVLAAETIPVPLSLHSPLDAQPREAANSLGWLVKLMALALVLWFIARRG